MTDIKKQARQLAALLNMRGVGHTTLMLEGLINFEGDAIVVSNRDVDTRYYADGMFRKHAFGIDQLERAAGIRAPVCVDHAVVADLLNKLVNLCEELESR
jgi:hypothetical protein